MVNFRDKDGQVYTIDMPEKRLKGVRALVQQFSDIAGKAKKAA